MSHHKSLGSSSKGEMRTIRRLDLWISRECCIKILQIKQNISLPLLLCGTTKATFDYLQQTPFLLLCHCQW